MVNNSKESLFHYLVMIFILQRKEVNNIDLKRQQELIPLHLLLEKHKVGKDQCHALFTD
jgi:hypothetical protein